MRCRSQSGSVCLAGQWLHWHRMTLPRCRGWLLVYPLSNHNNKSSTAGMFRGIFLSRMYTQIQQFIVHSFFHEQAVNPSPQRWPADFLIFSRPQSLQPVHHNHRLPSVPVLPPLSSLITSGWVRRIFTDRAGNGLKQLQTDMHDKYLFSKPLLLSVHYGGGNFLRIIFWTKCNQYIWKSRNYFQ